MNNIWDAILPFLLFAFILGILLNDRFSKRINQILWWGAVAAVTVVHLAVGLASNDNARLLSLMPVTAYLPMVIAVFFLSKRNVSGNAFTVFIGFIAALIVKLTVKLLGVFIIKSIKSGIVGNIFCLALTLTVCGLIGFVCFYFLRKVFRGQNVLDNRTWYVNVSLFFLTGLSVYMMSILQDIAAITLVLLVNTSVFAVIVGFLNSKRKNEILQREFESMERQMEAERVDYRRTEQNLELGRRYRHDMRHHFAVLKQLLGQNDISEAKTYIEDLGARLSELSKKTYSKNNVVNAVLSAALGRAQENDVEIRAQINIPEELSLDSIDVCTVLSNLIENAVHACMAVEKERRYIAVCADCTGEDKFMLSVENVVCQKVPLNAQGFPLAKSSEEHGYGLASVRYIAQKYNGIVHCASGDDAFCVKVVLFGQNPIPEKRPRKTVKLRSLAVFPLVFMAGVLSLNFMPSTIDSLEKIPMLGKAVEVIDFRHWGFSWGDSGIEVDYPETNEPETEKTLAEYIDECRKKFIWYFERKYSGYVAADITYTVLEDSDKKLVIEMNCTINAGSSLSFSRYFVVDRAKGKLVSLAELFDAESEYIEVLSEEIRRQIEIRVKENYDFYFGYGIFDSPEDKANAFNTLSADANFYIDADGCLVFVFDEGEIAPNSMGTPSFTVPYETIADIVKQEGLLGGGGA